jgi:L-asparagine transporter-like permease
MAHENTVPIAVIVGFVTSIILLILVLRWLRLKNNQKKAMHRDLEAAKLGSSASSDGAWDALTPVASPQGALYYANAREERSLMNGYAAEQKMDNEWRAARMAQARA